jgi:hypothetical protein
VSNDSLISSESKFEGTEMPTYHLPPKYMEKYDIANDMIKELYIKCKQIFNIVNKLQEDQQKRIMIKFNDDENNRLDKQIKLSKFEITKKIKDCENNIKDITYSRVETESERRGNN